MKSPFRGMDPYIECCGLWGDFHAELINEIKRALAVQLPEKYVIRQEERSYIALAGEEGKEEYPFVPDVRVIEEPEKKGKTARKRSPSPSETAADAEAVTIQAFVPEEHRETFITIFENEPEKRLVTCIEILSPANKRKKSRGRKLYQRKRQSLLLGAANFVEIDLLRGGERFPMMGPWPGSPYTLLVCRETRAPLCKVWPGYFHRPLPELPIPLTAPDPDIPVALQPLIASIYSRSRYHRDIDYDKPLTPPLSEAETAWFAERAKTRRK